MFWLFTGFLLLFVGARFFLDGAVGFARSFGISPYLIGLTIVGFGTSAPELAANLSAALAGSHGMSLGNIVGSNIANIGLILGLSAVVQPLQTRMRLLIVEGPLMIGVGFIFWWMLMDGRLSRLDASILLAGFAAVAAFLYASAGREPREVQDQLAGAAAKAPARLRSAIELLVGLSGLVIGAEWMVDGASGLARSAGVSETVIGLTVVAVGTSLPELASTLTAAWRNEADIAVGNVLGSNIFNILLILGLTALVQPLNAPASLLGADVPVMIVFSIALLAAMYHKMRITRSEAALLLAGYVVFLLLQSQRPL